MKSSPIFFIVVATTIIANWKYAKYVVAAILIIAAFKFIQKILIFAVSLFENFRLKEVDAMGGIEFEKHVGKILRNNGYTNIHFTEKYDYGVVNL